MSSAYFRSPVLSGSRIDLRREAYKLRYGLRLRTCKASTILTNALMAQLGACKSEEARRLILGVSA